LRNPPSPPLGLRRHPHTAKASLTSVSRNLKKIKIMEKSESLKTEERQEKKKMDGENKVELDKQMHFIIV